MKSKGALISKFNRLVKSSTEVMPLETVLEKLGCVKEGDVVGVVEPNSFLLSQIFLILLDRKAIPVVIPEYWSPNRIDATLEENPVTFLWNNQNLQSTKFSDFKRALKDGDFATFSSGVSGRPKIHFFSVEGAFFNAKAHALSLNISESTLLFQTLPLFHAFGLIAYIFTPLFKNCAIIFTSHFSGWQSLIHFPQQTVIHLTPTWVKHLIKTNKLKTHSCENVVFTIGSAFLSKNEISYFQEITNSQIYITYGLTEAGPRLTTGLWHNEQDHFIGRALPGLSIKVLTEGKKLQDHGFGRLAFNSKSISLNADSRNFIEGYYCTTDSVSIDANGIINLFHRFSRKFKWRELEIDLDEIENVLDCGVMAAVSRSLGEEYWILFLPGFSSESVRDLIAQQIPSSVFPNHVVFFENLNLSSLQKIDLIPFIERINLPTHLDWEFYQSKSMSSYDHQIQTHSKK